MHIPNLGDSEQISTSNIGGRSDSRHQDPVPVPVTNKFDGLNQNEVDPSTQELSPEEICALKEEWTKVLNDAQALAKELDRDLSGSHAQSLATSTTLTAEISARISHINSHISDLKLYHHLLLSGSLQQQQIQIDF